MSNYPPNYHEQLEQFWHTYVSMGTLDDVPPAGLRPEIAQSWVRSKKHRVNPLDVKARTLTSDQTRELLARKKNLLDAAKSYISNIYSFVEGSGYMVVLTDEHGYTLDMIGDDDMIRTMTHNSNLVIGANRSEEYAGTNAIGTSLVIQRPIQIWGEEHFVRSHHPFTCSAAPIRDARGRIVGCLDLTGPKEHTHAHTLGMVVAAVGGIEKSLQMEETNQTISLVNKQLRTTIQSISSGVVMIDRFGTITQMNDLAANLLHMTPEALYRKNLADIIRLPSDLDTLDFFSKNISNKEVAFVTPSGLTTYLSLTATVIYNDYQNQIGAVVVIDEVKKLHKLVSKMSGFQATYTFDSIIGHSPEIQNIKELGMIAAGSSSNVLILGESGTGKELVAQSIHNASNRSRGPFIAINCGSLPKSLIESELFGYEAGAFTGASKDGHPGKFELAEGGTIFLDEIGDMPLDLQASLLRVLQTKEIIRIGGKRAKTVDVRIMAATNQNLKESVANNTFRNDLYYRLNVFTINTPPLRDHKEDIKELSDYFIRSCNASLHKNITGLSPDAMAALQKYPWPGNVRELENVLERAINLSRSEEIQLWDLPEYVTGLNSLEEMEHAQTAHVPAQPVYTAPQTVGSMKDMEKTTILNALIKTAGNMKKTAEILGIGRRTLYRKIEKYEIDVDSFR
ncbi:MAG: sigma 54-interacting transcriptional regulator [Firmicutes bacterium]|nr:sigma 54-interacting transcriptional regulator [Bacillota bacterium]